jgi:hypothetical protein
MANEFYVDEADRSPLSGVVDEEVYFGELVSDGGSGVTKFVYADSNESLGLARSDVQAGAAEDEDDTAEENYLPDEELRNRAQYHPNESDARVRPRTAQDNGTDPAPSIGHRDVVGVIDASGGTVASAGEFAGRIVEEGYTDDAATTYDRATGNFKAIGVAIRPAKQNGDAVTDFDYPTPVQLFGEVRE